MRVALLGSDDGQMKKCWYVSVPGYPPFPMIMQEDHDHAEALAFARGIWPTCTVE